MNRFMKRHLGHAKAAAKGGKRNGVYYRSRWEFNVSLWLNELKRRGEILDWKYEDKEFEFPVKRGTRFYKSDFHIFESNQDYFIEVKGFMSSKDVTALKRMDKYYPSVTVLILDKKRYAELESEFGDLEGWER